MYICSCHAVTDGAMRAHIKSGVRTFAKMAKVTGVATQCGICGRQAKELFYKILREEEALERAQAALAGTLPPEPSVASEEESEPAHETIEPHDVSPCGREGGCTGCKALCSGSH